MNSFYPSGCTSRILEEEDNRLSEEPEEEMILNFWIPLNEMKDGVYYYGKCRNADTARWDAKSQKFYHWRTKFTIRFVESIHHPENEKVFDVFYPFKEIDYSTPEIPILQSTIRE